MAMIVGIALLVAICVGCVAVAAYWRGRLEEARRQRDEALAAWLEILTEDAEDELPELAWWQRGRGADA